MPLLFWMVWYEIRAPPLNAPNPLLLFQLGAELIVTAAGSPSVTETPVTDEVVTVTFATLPTGFEAFWPP